MFTKIPKDFEQRCVKNVGNYSIDIYNFPVFFCVSVSVLVCMRVCLCV